MLCAKLAELEQQMDSVREEFRMLFLIRIER